MTANDKFLEVGIVENQYAVCEILINNFKEKNTLNNKELVDKYGIRLGNILSVIINKK